jgi:hypothetical protein
MLHWWRIFAAEVTIIFLVVLALGYIKPPKWMRRRTIARGFPWGYYRDRIPASDPGYYNEHSNDFLHDVGTEFGGIEGFGDFGEFTGFGEMGEFGNNFGAGGHGGFE